MEPKQTNKKNTENLVKTLPLPPQGNKEEMVTRDKTHIVFAQPPPQIKHGVLTNVRGLL